jgi:hypothetical protein
LLLAEEAADERSLVVEKDFQDVSVDDHFNLDLPAGW